MHDSRTHPLLAQVPLTVSPFISLPTSATLPYTYKPMPSTLPPSATGITSTSASGPVSSVPDGAAIPEGAGRPRYVVSQSGHAAHPDDIIASCRALRDYLEKLKADAEQELREVDERIRARELAEKRRVAPGWLDSDARLLEPERAGGSGSGSGLDLMTGDVGAGEGAAAGETAQLQGLSLGGGGGAEHGVLGQVSEMAAHEDEGAQLDRAFGSLAYRPK